jgi:hypothetical protein
MLLYVDGPESQVRANGESNNELTNGETTIVGYVTIRIGMTIDEVFSASHTLCYSMTFVGNGFIVTSSEWSGSVDCDKNGKIIAIMDRFGKRIDSGVMRIPVRPK